MTRPGAQRASWCSAFGACQPSAIAPVRWDRRSHIPASAGGLTRAEGQDRIEFLAQVRNAALEPLWKESSNGSAWGSEGGFKADRIVFINDVYFCTRDIVRPSFCVLACSLAPATASMGRCLDSMLCSPFITRTPAPAE